MATLFEIRRKEIKNSDEPLNIEKIEVHGTARLVSETGVIPGTVISWNLGFSQRLWL